MCDFPKTVIAVGRDFSEIEDTEFFVREDGKNVCVKRGDKSYKFLEKARDTFLDGRSDLKAAFDLNKYGKMVGVLRNKELKVEAWSDEKKKVEEHTVDFTLQIKCRFDSDNKAFFLATMMLDFDNLKPINTKVLKSDDIIFEIMLFRLFCEQFKEASRKGFFNTYVRFEHNDSRPRGVIDIARHIRLNAGQENGRIAYNTREHTAENSFNRLIIAAYEHLKSKFSFVETRFNNDSELCAAMATLRQIAGVPERNTRRIVSDNLRPIAHPFYLEYEELRRTCLKILRDEGVSIFDAESSEQTDSLLMDVTKLWEKFLEKRIGAKLSEGFRLEPQKSKETVFNKRAQPDLVVYNGKNPVVILDAKFKTLWEEAYSGGNCSNSYLDEDINKCIRDLTVFRTNFTGVAFPAKEHESGCLSDVIDKDENGQGELSFNMVCVKIPNVNNVDYNTWLDGLEGSTDKAIDLWIKQWMSKVDIKAE